MILRAQSDRDINKMMIPVSPRSNTMRISVGGPGKIVNSYSIIKKTIANYFNEKEKFTIFNLRGG